MVIVEATTKIILGFVQLAIGLGLAMASIYLGMRIITRLTKGRIDPEPELAKGNKAIAVFTLGMIVAIAIVISGGIAGLTTAITSLPPGGDALAYLRAVGGGLVQLIFGIVFAGISITVGLTMWDRITKEIDEIEELKRDNLAVGIVLAGVLIAVAIVIQSGISSLSSAFGL